MLQAPDRDSMVQWALDIREASLSPAGQDLQRLHNIYYNNRSFNRPRTLSLTSLPTKSDQVETRRHSGSFTIGSKNASKFVSKIQIKQWLAEKLEPNVDE
jgi:hypothetical protein